jgi:hypothetical protein
VLAVVKSVEAVVPLVEEAVVLLVAVEAVVADPPEVHLAQIRVSSV